jgi:hypothetical protein
MDVLKLSFKNINLKNNLKGINNKNIGKNEEIEEK